MTYIRWRLHARAWRLLPFALLLAPFVITGGGRLAYSSVSPVPLRGALPHHSAAQPLPPRFLPASCAPQLAVTPVASETPTATAATPTPLSASAPVLDQAQLMCTGGLSVRANPTQTFTVGISGQLVRVDIPLCAPTKNARIEVTVSATSGSAQASTAALTLPHDYSDCAWYAFDFTRPIVAAANDILQLRVRPRITSSLFAPYYASSEAKFDYFILRRALTVTSPNHRSALWGYDGQGPNLYPGGTASWRGQAVNSFAFQTYMR